MSLSDLYFSHFVFIFFFWGVGGMVFWGWGEYLLVFGSLLSFRINVNNIILSSTDLKHAAFW